MIVADERWISKSGQSSVMLANLVFTNAKPSTAPSEVSGPEPVVKYFAIFDGLNVRSWLKVTLCLMAKWIPPG